LNAEWVLSSSFVSCEGYALICLHVLPFQLAFAVRQDDFDIAGFAGAEAEVGDGFLAGGVAVADGNFARAEERIGLAELAGRVNSDDRANGLEIDAGWTLVARQIGPKARCG
jgi:hypothetical protein